MRGWRAVAIVSMAAALAACGGDAENTTEAATESESAMSESSMEAPPTPMLGAENANAPGPRQNDLGARLQAAMRTLDVMRRAGSEAAEATEGDDCDKGYASIRAALRAAQELERTLPGARAPRYLVAPEARYLELCRQLPEDARRCTRYDHRSEYAHECRATREGLTDAQRAMWDEMSQPLRNTSRGMAGAMVSTGM